METGRLQQWQPLRKIIGYLHRTSLTLNFNLLFFCNILSPPSSFNALWLVSKPKFQENFFERTSSCVLYWLNFEIVASLISMRKWFFIFITACDGVEWGEVKVFIYWRFDVFDSIGLLNWRSDSSKYDECLAHLFNWHAIFVIQQLRVSNSKASFAGAFGT